MQKIRQMEFNYIHNALRREDQSHDSCRRISLCMLALQFWWALPAAWVTTGYFDTAR